MLSFCHIIGLFMLVAIATAQTKCPTVNRCQNGAACKLNATKNQVCTCLTGFSGPTCGAVATNPCAINPCTNGTCTPVGSDYMCQCQYGYSGKDCDIYNGYCAKKPCNSLDPGASCIHGTPVGLEKGYQCDCSSSDYFGLNCEAETKNCNNHEESYCICMVNNEPVKFPIPSPEPYDGINLRDIISAILGLLFGWLLGTLLLHCCCSRDRVVREERPWTAQSNDTMTSDLSVPPTRPVAPAKVSGQTMVTNVYRTAFVDELSHTVSTRKSTGTYQSGRQDW